MIKESKIVQSYFNTIKPAYAHNKTLLLYNIIDNKMVGLYISVINDGSMVSYISNRFLSTNFYNKRNDEIAINI